MISRFTIDQVFETARVEEVIGDFVQLKKSGANYKGLSPFTDERSPSFMVSPVKQIWKDFSSGKGGNAVAFLMEHEHFNYPEAIKYLAKKYNIEIEETEQTPEEKEMTDARESLYLVNDFARDYFKNVLTQTESGKAIGLSYFKERGFTTETIEKFQLGYGLDQWDAFTSEALKQGYKLSYLEQTGLTIVKGDKQFDRFKGRVLFPIHSLSGRVLGFGGRILTSDKKAAKYVNSPESDVYHKSKVLYGIHFAKQTIAKEDQCYLVEGYTDVIQMHQRGLTNVVASSGTALTPEQIRLVNRLTPNMTLLFDGDAAGLRASLRGVDLILEQGMNVRICAFPEGEDPDSFSRAQTLDQLKDYLEKNTKDFISFKASLLAQDAANDPIKKSDTIRDMVTSISKIPDHIKQEVYLKECARIMDISQEVLFSTLAQILKKNRSAESVRKVDQGPNLEVIANKQTQSVKVDVQFELERKIIEMLLLYGTSEQDFQEYTMESQDDGVIKHKEEKVRSLVYQKIYLDLQEDEIEFTHPEFQVLYYKIIEAYHQNKAIRIEAFIQDLPQNLSEMVSHILMDEEKHQLHQWGRKDIVVKDKEANVSQIVTETILNLRRFLVTEKINELNTLFDPKTESVSDPDTLRSVIDYIGLKKVLSDKLNRVL
ncbi:MAG: DNA primase [Cryomorphaceae bacterium BACL21 MAG-121220-bin10]|jgi:DNA primase|nr:MAG: DNA primase [Cryomorphaceae bacterium BACL21 MAG-121220-bin10]|tara:strand:- start:103244 stop:105208 length:1965 start_codon:yes stop_codon:yes gene_type:complete